MIFIIVNIIIKTNFILAIKLVTNTITSFIKVIKFINLLDLFNNFIIKIAFINFLIFNLIIYLIVIIKTMLNFIEIKSNIIIIDYS